MVELGAFGSSALFSRYSSATKIWEELWSDVYIAEIEPRGGIPAKSYLIRVMAPDAGVATISACKREEEVSKLLYTKFPRSTFAVDDYIHMEQYSATVWCKSRHTILLKDYLATLPSFKSQFIDIAEQIVQRIHELHSIGVIHRNIRPQSFWIDTETKEIFLFDFVSSSNWKEYARNNLATTFGVPVCGTLQYMSPEHTGKLDHPIDYRSDIYSLGILWYEILSGHLPFEMITEQMAILYAQVAVQIPPLHQLDDIKEEVPYIISRIISKMINKNANERYQSATGLLHDLKMAKTLLDIPKPTIIRKPSLWENIPEAQAQNKQKTEFLSSRFTGSREDSDDLQMSLLKLIQPQCTQVEDEEDAFVLGSKDYSSSLRSVYEIIGREDELQSIIDCFHNSINSSKPVSVLIGGYSGIGKSTLVVAALRKLKVDKAQKILQGKGKFAQYTNDPYGGFTALFCDLLDKGISEYSTKEVAEVLQNLNSNDISLLSSHLIPTIKSLFPDHKIEVDDDTTARQNQQYTELAAIKFLCGISKLYNNHVVIFLDDVQWAAANSVSLLQKLLEKCNFALLAILAFRDNEITKGHCISKFLTSVHADHNSKSIELAELSKESCARFVSITLGIETLNNNIKNLITIIYMKTKGNPFFMSQFISMIYSQGMLFFDMETLQWDCDVLAIQEQKHADNVVDMLIYEIQKLNQQSTELLQIASCIGNSFDIETLAIIAELEESKVVSLLSPAIFAGYIQPTYSHSTIQEYYSNHEFAGEPSVFKFVHDRVHESFYLLVSTEKRPSLHFKIGNMLKQQSNRESWSPSYLFCVAHHLNESRLLITEKSEILYLVKLNRAAANIASKGGAYQKALEFGTIGVELLHKITPDSHSADVWELYYTDIIPLKQSIIESRYLLAQYELAQEEFEFLLSRVKTTRDRIHSRTVCASLLSTLGKYNEATEQHLEVLKELGETVEGLKLSLSAKWENFLATIPTGCASYFSSLPIDDSDELRNIYEENLFELSVAAYFLQDIDMHASVLMTGLYSCIRKGSRTSATGPMLAGVGVQNQFFFGASVISCEFLNVGYELSFETSKQWNIAEATYLISNGIMFYKSLEQSNEIYNRVKITTFRTNAVNQLSYVAAYKIITPMLYGQDLRSLKDTANQLLDIFDNLNCPPLYSVRGALFSISMLLYNQPPSNWKSLETKVPCMELWEAFTELFKSLMFWVLGDDDLALQSICALEELLPYTNNLLPSIGYTFLSPLVRIRAAENPENCLPEILDSLVKLKAFATLSRDNFGAQYLFILAEKLRIEGAPVFKVLRYYERAIRIAEKNGFSYVAGMAAERAYNLVVTTEYSDDDFDFDVSGGQAESFTIGNSFLRQSFLFYQSWGATAKCALLKRENHILSDTKRQSQSSPMSSIGEETNNSTLSSIVLGHATQLLTTEGSIQKIINVISIIIMEHAGANRGFIFSDYQDSLYVLASWEDSNVTVYPLPQEIEHSEGGMGEQNDVKFASEIRDEFPYSLIRDVANGAINVSPYEYFDGYKFESKVKSAVCVPMKHGGKISGVLYLENTLTTGAFPKQQDVMLQHLAAQIGGSIERTCLYLNQKQILAELQKQNQMLVMLDRIKNDFVNNMSHELRTPLNAILGFCQSLQETNLNSYQTEYCDAILSSGEVLLSIINDILSIREYQENNYVLSSSRFELRGILDKLLRMMGLESKPIILNCNWDSSLEDSLWLDADHERLSQVLINLLSNAVKFTERGNIVLRVINETNSDIIDRFALQENELLLRFEVLDTGIGISPEYMENIFKPFTQADTSSIRKYQGAGLGLAISQNIVKALSNNKSKIEYFSEPGVGTTFSFEIPFKRVCDIVPEPEFVETFNRAICGCSATFVSTNKYSLHALRQELHTIPNISLSNFQTLHEASEYITANLNPKSQNSKTSTKHFCIIDTENIGIEEFKKKFKRFVKKFDELQQLFFVLLVPAQKRNNFHSMLFDCVKRVDAEHFASIITCPIKKYSVLITLAQLALNRSPVSIARTGSLSSPLVNTPIRRCSQPMERTKNIRISAELLQAVIYEPVSAPISFPQKQPDAIVSEPVEEKVNDTLSVLMFEDNKMNKKLQERFLKQLGIQCLTVENGKVGIDLLSESKDSRLDEFDMILMDCHMPLMDGFEATKLIRELEEKLGKPHKHVIAITAGQDKQKCFDAGMCFIISKPVKKSMLQDVLSDFNQPQCPRCEFVNNK